jgi:hypothetical protein
MRQFAAAAVFFSSLLALPLIPANAWAASGQQNGANAPATPTGAAKVAGTAPTPGAPAPMPKPVPPKPKPKAPATIVIPDIYSGATYNITLVPSVPGWKQPVTCVPVPALPSWLKLDCSASTFKFSSSAAVPVTASDVVTPFALTVIDANNKQFAYKFQFTLRPAVDTISLGAKAAAPAAVLPLAPPDYSKIKFNQTSLLQEGATQTAGQLLNVPANASLHIQLWTQPEGSPGPATQMPLLSPTAPPATLPQVDLKSNAYTLQFTSPLAAGQTLQLMAVTDDGTPVVTLPPQTLPAAITVGPMQLTVEKPVSVGAKTISGILTGLPTPSVKPVAASGATPAFYGNVPGIVVWWMDATSKTWSQAAPTVGANPPQFLSVNSDGSFVVTLPSALVAGQKIRVDVVPPPGRSFAAVAPLPALPPPPTAVPLMPPSETITVLTNTTLSLPTISSTPFNEGTIVISGTATVPVSGVPLGVAIVRLRAQAHDPPIVPAYCLTSDNLNVAPGDTILPLTSSSSNTLLGAIDTTAGTYKVTLAGALKEDDLVEVVQVLPAGSAIPAAQFGHCASVPRRVAYPFDFHRTDLNFIAGVLLSNSSSGSTTSANFSQANQFYAFNADHAWRLPGYDCIERKQWGEFEYGKCGKGERSRPGWHTDGAWPGISTFFEARLTSIPVSTASATVVPSPTSSSSTTSSTTPTSTLLTSQKVFRVETGAYLPWVVSHGKGDHPNGLFIAPLAKVGFDTVTGAGTSSNVILPGGGTGTLNFQTAYNFYVYGGRIGNMALSESHDRAPQIEHYLDVTFGRYSNLESYVCHKLPAGVAPPSPVVEPSGTSCLTDYPILFPPGTQVVDSRKQLYRIDIEGLVKIPIPATAIPFYIGFNANISQHSWQAENLDHGYAPPDDIRILFGTRIDIGALLSSFKLGAN